MIDDKSILAIIPARGGSKGIPRKNIKMLNGKPLIAWTIEAAHSSQYIDRTILSSEDEEIITVAKSLGCEVPFVRPKSLSGDFTPGIDPVIHAIQSLSKQYYYIILLQPTSPLRLSKDIDNAIELFSTSNALSLVSVSQAPKSPEWMFKISKDNLLIQNIEYIKSSIRQELPAYYSLNGAIYISTSSSIINNKSFITKNTMAFNMCKERSLDIDDQFDFDICDLIMKHNNSATFR